MHILNQKMSDPLQAVTFVEGGESQQTAECMIIYSNIYL